MRRILIAAVTAAALAGGAGADVRIGMITTLSGGGSHLGIDVRDGFRLALAQSGREDIELLVRDDARKPARAKQIADEMIRREEVDILTGLIFSNLAMAVVPSTVRQGIFYLSPNAGPSKLAGTMCHENYFNVAWQNNDLHAAMGKYMREQGRAAPFILAPNYPAGTDALTGFKETYGPDVAEEVYTRLGQKDYAAEIAQIRASDADSVFFFLPGGMGIAFLKQYAASGVDLPVYGPAFSFDEIILGAVGEAAVGVKNTSQWAHDLDNAANEAFVAAFREEYARTPTLYASQGYDTARLILSALDDAHPGEDPDGFRAALERADFESVRGDFRFNTNHHPIQDIHVREVAMGSDGTPTNRLVGVAIEDRRDAFADQCGM